MKSHQNIITRISLLLISTISLAGDNTVALKERGNALYKSVYGFQNKSIPVDLKFTFENEEGKKESRVREKYTLSIPTAWKHVNNFTFDKSLQIPELNKLRMAIYATVDQTFIKRHLTPIKNRLAIYLPPLEVTMLKELLTHKRLVLIENLKNAARQPYAGKEEFDDVHFQASPSSFQPKAGEKIMVFSLFTDNKPKYQTYLFRILPLVLCEKRLPWCINIFKYAIRSLLRYDAPTYYQLGINACRPSRIIVQPRTKESPTKYVFLPKVKRVSRGVADPEADSAISGFFIDFSKKNSESAICAGEDTITYPDDDDDAAEFDGSLRAKRPKLTSSSSTELSHISTDVNPSESPSLLSDDNVTPEMPTNKDVLTYSSEDVPMAEADEGLFKSDEDICAFVLRDDVGKPIAEDDTRTPVDEIFMHDAGTPIPPPYSPGFPEKSVDDTMYVDSGNTLHQKESGIFSRLQCNEILADIP